MKVYKWLVVLCVFLMLVFAFGCQKKKENKSPTKSSQNTSTTSSPNSEAQTGVSGIAVDVINVPNYTYVLVKDKMGVETWVAIPTAKIKKGQKVTFAPGVVMHDFHSNTLNRTFHEIVFSSGLAGSNSQQVAAQMPPSTCPAGAPPARWPSKESKSTSSASQMPSMSMMMGSSGKVGAGPVHPPKTTVKVKKATGKNAYTIAELYKLASKLNNKTIKVRGLVIKVLPAIMGRNWIHIQDGTGGSKTKDYDLVVTSQQLPKVGEVITVVGVLHANKDFGYGYKYPVIIEDAKILK